MKKKKSVDSIKLPEGYVFSQNFRIIGHLGGGWEGEVYSVQEISTGIERAAKFFYPDRNIKNQTAKFYARKLHKLRNCSILMKYYLQEKMIYKGHELTYLISDYVEGETLDDFLYKQPGKRLHPFQAIHLLHCLASGLNEIHSLKEYHGDLHTGNIIVQRCGLTFDVKLVDLFHLGSSSPQKIRYDITDLIRVFYECTGGKKHYNKQPQVVKDICCGLKNSLILSKFRTAGQLKNYLENLVWD
jgi:tRNA A-37 threonylcarbamoyl transferase component Bud32